MALVMTSCNLQKQQELLHPAAKEFAMWQDSRRWRWRWRWRWRKASHEHRWRRARSGEDGGGGGGGGEEEDTMEEIRTETEKKKKKQTDLTEHGEVSRPSKWRLSKSSEGEDRRHKHKQRQGLEKLHDDGWTDLTKTEEAPKRPGKEEWCGKKRSLRRWMGSLRLSDSLSLSLSIYLSFSAFLITFWTSRVSR